MPSRFYRLSRSLSPLARNVAGTLRDTYLSADVRWLGIFRVLYGCLLIVELGRRWLELRLYYSDDGVLPAAFAHAHAVGVRTFSVYFAARSVWAVELAFWLTLLCFVTFTLGYRTRLFHALSLLCVFSLDSRNVLLSNVGTTVVTLLGAWTLFLPLGRRLSIDALLASLRARNEASSDELNDRPAALPGGAQYRSVAVFGLLLQWSAIYFFDVVHESGPYGAALYEILAQRCGATGLGVWASGHLSPGALREIARTVLYGEACLSCVLLVPVWRRQARLIGLTLALALHVVRAATRLGPFSYAMVLGVLIHLSAADLAIARRWFGRASLARTVVFDSDCGICLLVCRVLKRLDPLQRLTFLGNDERDRFPVSIDSALLDRSLVVVLPNGGCVSEGRAVFEVLRALPLGTLLGWWLRVPGLANLGNALYRLVARNRAQISSRLGLAACGVPSPQGSPASEPAATRDDDAHAWPLLRELLAATFLIMLAIQALSGDASVRERVRGRRPRFMAAIVDSARLFDIWSSYAPEPPDERGHLVVDAQTLDGRRLDPFTGQPPMLDPSAVTGWRNDSLWCDYTNSLRRPTGTLYRPLLVTYLRRWQKVTGRPRDQLLRADVWWVRSRAGEPSAPLGVPPVPQHLLSFGDAFGSPAHVP